jgi:chloride channel protein, CIC family
LNPSGNLTMNGRPSAFSEPALNEKLRDFTMTPRVLWISALAVFVGFVSAFVALALVRLIGLMTNLFFYGRWASSLVSPAGNHLGPWEVAIPVAGALIVGLMARFGSEKIRGHGIPEALEAILINRSRVEPKVAFLKPLSSAISIGSGGPFGAEGPIIMSGGAFGSMIAQFFHLSAMERKTLLAAGAAGGMAAIFSAPVSAVLLAVELLLFEWKPRSLIPVALASVAAGATRLYLLGMGPMFPTPPHPAFIGPLGLLSCLAVGLLAGVLSVLLTEGVYLTEDFFHRLPLHWMWWPLLGGLVIGIGGLIFPPALGVGYDLIGDLLRGDSARTLILGILIVKSIIWAFSLGSGTSGGVLAPLLMIGGALGGIEALFLPHYGPGFWPLLSMGAVLAGTMRAPLTAVVFSIELTGDLHMMAPLLLASAVAYGFTVLVLRRSILTEKVARRGYHLSYEYAVDPMEAVFVREAMRSASGPVVLASSDEPVAYPDEPLRSAIHRMAAHAVSRLPVVRDEGSQQVIGALTLEDALGARSRLIEEELRRERTLGWHPLPRNASDHDGSAPYS